MTRKSFTALFGAGLLTASTLAQANLQQSLDSMFTSNVTQPGAYNSQTRTGFVGGGIELRTPIKQINLATFDPPRMSAGCGGLDLYGGSFSFINSAQLTALFRQIMNNAQGLMFQSSINAICPSCAAILTDFQKKIQEMNAAMSNTCAIANMTLDTLKLPGSDHTKAEETENNIKTAWNNTGDWFSAKTGSTASKNQDMIATENQNPLAGNMTWKALLRSQIDQKYGFVGMSTSPDPDFMKKILMSMIGTKINTANGVTTAEISTPVTWDPILKFSDFMDTAKNGVEYYEFDKNVTISDSTDPTDPLVGKPAGYNSTEPRLTATQLKTAFPGVRPYVRGILYGDPGVGNTPSAPAAGTLFWNLQNCGNTSGSALCNLTSNQQQFLQIMPAPMLNLIKESQGLGVMDALMPEITNVIENSILLSMANAIYNLEIQVWNNVHDVAVPATVIDAQKNMVMEIANLQDGEKTYADQLQKASQLVDIARQKNPLPLKN